MFIRAPAPSTHLFRPPAGMSSPWHAKNVGPDGPVLDGFRGLSEAEQAAVCARLRKAAPAAAAAATAAGHDEAAAVEAGLAALFAVQCSSTGADPATTRVGVCVGHSASPLGSCLCVRVLLTFAALRAAVYW